MGFGDVDVTCDPPSPGIRLVVLDPVVDFAKQAKVDFVLSGSGKWKVSEKLFGSSGPSRRPNRKLKLVSDSRKFPKYVPHNLDLLVANRLHTGLCNILGA